MKNLILCGMNNVNESNLFTLFIVIIFLFGCSVESVDDNSESDGVNSDNSDEFFTNRFSGTFWQNNEVENFQRVLSFQKTSLFELLSLTKTDINPKWYCYYWHEGVFNLDYFEEGYDKTIIEISKNERDIFAIDEIASYTNSNGEIENLHATITFKYIESDNSIKMDVVCDGKFTIPVIFTKTEFEKHPKGTGECNQVYVIGGC